MGPIIDLTHLFPWRIIMLFTYSVAFFNIYRAILKDKFHPILTFLAIFAARIITSIAFFNYDSLNSFGYLAFSVLCFIILLLMTEGKLYDKFFVIITSLISQFTGAAINGTVTMIIFNGKEYTEIYGTENMNLDHMILYLSECVVFLIIGILFSAFLKAFKKKRSKLRTSKLLIYISAYPVTHILFILIPFLVVPIELDHNYLGAYSYIIIFVLFVFIMIIDCAFPIIINHFEKIEEENIEKERELVKNTMNYHQMLMLKQEKQEFRKIKHDFANIITTAKGFIEIGKPEKALNILQNTGENLLGLAGFSICSNETVNTIIYIKQQQAERNGIKLHTEIYEDFSINIDEYDLCRILHNIIDNALNGASTAPDNHYVKIEIDITDIQIKIKSENNYSDSKKQRMTKAANEHGNGIGIIKEIASKYSGKYAARQFNGVWYTETYLDNKKPANSTPPRILP